MARARNFGAGNGNWWRPCNYERKLLIGPEHSFHWLHKRTSCSLVGKYGWKAVGSHAIWFGFLTADSGGSSWCPCSKTPINPISKGVLYIWLVYHVVSCLKNLSVQTFHRIYPQHTRQICIAAWREENGRTLSWWHLELETKAIKLWSWMNKSQYSLQICLFFSDIRPSDLSHKNT